MRKLIADFPCNRCRLNRLCKYSSELTQRIDEETYYDNEGFKITIECLARDEIIKALKNM